MELKQLQYFLAVADELHFTKAAEKLRIAQPPLSRQIQQLEREVGTMLFQRNNRKVELTAAGEYLKQEARQLFGRINSIKQQIGLIHQGVRGRLRIGYVGAVMHSLLPEVLKELRSQYPDVSTLLSELGNEAQITALKNGQLDIGFIRTPLQVDTVVAVPICRETFSVIVSSDHRLGNQVSIQLSDLAAEPFICFSRDCAPGMVDQIVGICNQAGFSPNKIHESSQINTILRLVESNLGYSIVPSSVCHGYNLNIRYYELTDIPERAEIELIYNPAAITPLTRNVIRLVAGYFSGDQPKV
ncbi:MAG: LysR family transcriptional regulator [Negativicutes bacterium]|nr:LysR family transcriptional regulator [Negativicutes bacterium]